MNNSIISAFALSIILSFTCHAADIAISTKCGNDAGWMLNGWGNYSITVSNSTPDPVRIVKITSAWQKGSSVDKENLDISVVPGTTHTLTRTIYLPEKTINKFGDATPVIAGTLSLAANAETNALPFLVEIPIATLPEPLVTITGSYIGVALQQSRYTNFPAQNTMVRWLDQAYKQMWNLTGGRPYNDALVIYKECPAHPWWAYAGNPIVLNYNFVESTVDDYNNELPSFGWIHELGHDFDDGIGQWYNYDGPSVEFQANIKLVYALLHMRDRDLIRMKHAGNAYKVPDKDRKRTVDEWLSVFARYFGDTYLASTNSWHKMESDDYLSFFMRIADVYGWDSIEQWYRAYRRLQAQNFVPPSSPEDKINLICAILSETTGTNMVPAFQLWRLPVSNESVAAIKERYNGISRSPSVQVWHVLPKTVAWTNTSTFVACTPERLNQIIADTKAAPLKVSNSPIINIYNLLPEDALDFRAVYVLRTITCDKPCTVNILTGSDDALRIWLNGKPIQQVLECRENQPDSESVQAALQKGDNTLLAEISNAGEDWSFILRLTDENNNPLELTDNGSLVKPAAVKTIFDK